MGILNMHPKEVVGDMKKEILCMSFYLTLLKGEH